MSKNTSIKTETNACACNNVQHINQHTKQKKISRYIDYAKMIMPAVVFTIIPKCPVCLAGYIALSTGVGLSITTATYLRIVLIVLCILSLTYFIVRHIRRFIINSH